MKIMLIILGIVAIFVIADSLRTIFLFTKSTSLVKNTTPFNRRIPGASMRILVLGDSTAYGTGSDTSEDSTAGRLGSLYPEAEIINRSVNGLKIAGLLDLLETMEDKEKFDIVLIQIGANDIIRLTPMVDIEVGIRKVLLRVQSFGGKVIVLHSGNVGEAPFFPLYIRPFLSKRSFEVRTIYQSIAREQGVDYVDLIDSPIATTLKEDSARYYANDRLHLSSDGYGLWMQEIRKYLPK